MQRVFPRILIGVVLFSGLVQAQPESVDEAPAKTISVKAASDQAVRQRIHTILTASGWFDGIRVENDSGIVTLHGSASADSHKKWAEDIAYRTEDVVAVVNKLHVVNPNPWSLQPLADKSRSLVERGLAFLPLAVVGLVILALAWFAARKLAGAARRLLAPRIESVMLRNLIARLLAIPILIIGVYLVFSVSGLGSLAATLIGGTGLIGLVIGIAFRDITENFLASVLLSIQRPFVLGDMIRVLDFTGMVEAMTTRGTVLMTLDGNHVQIPNTIIYKEPITNFSANPNTRQSFIVGIGYDASISEVQSLVLEWLDQHPAVLKEPEPLILAEQLGASTVNIGVYFWVNTRTHSPLKVRSSVIRTVKFKLMEAGISMPDDAREVIFPQGVDVHLRPGEQHRPQSEDTAAARAPEHRAPPAKAAVRALDARDASLTTDAEGSLASEEQDLKKQARNSQLGESNQNLLR